MAKELDLSHSVYELVQEYPELIEIMVDLGFTEIQKKAVLNSVGKMITIPKGATMKGIPMDNVFTAMMEHGFELTGDMPPSVLSAKGISSVTKTTEGRTEQLKSYLKRLGAGENLESIRADFVEHFSDVEASEIMRAEQELLAEGTALTEVQKLCDVHSALFHGSTREENIFNTEKAVEASLKKETVPQADYSNKHEKAAALAALSGHPMQTLTQENNVLKSLLTEAKEKLVNKENLDDALIKIRDIAIHYAKKGDLLYPHLKVKYSISGPSDVMWTVDDEIRDELAALVKDTIRNEAWTQRVQTVLQRAEEMIYKEANILFPICAVNFNEDEWKHIYQDFKDYAVCFGVEREVWEEAEKVKKAVPQIADEVVMPGGHMTVEQLTALLNTIPMEISFIDADNINRFFNEGSKVFERPGMAIDREVFSCHPPKIEPMVRAIIDDFRNNRRDSVPVWMEKNGRTMLVTYMAVRDKKKNYFGTVELVQDMEATKEHFDK